MQKSVEKQEGALVQVPELQTQNSNLILAIIVTAAFLDVIDYSIIQVALPAIRREWLVSIPDSQWIVGAYGLTMAGFLLLSGRLGDVYGQKRLFVIGVVLFSIASLTGGLAPSLLSLIISRAVQGFAAAVSSVTALSILVATFPEGRARDRAIGVFVSVLSAGFAAGSIAGGLITGLIGWRYVMFVNVPIGIGAGILSWKYLPNNGMRITDKRLDITGALAVTSGTILFVYGLTDAAENGFSSMSALMSLGLAVLILAGFVLIEKRSSAPLMPLDFLRRGVVLSSNILALLFSASAGGLGFILTIYLQQILGYSALQAGLAFLPPAIIFFIIGGWGSSWLVDKFGLKRVLLASMALSTIGSALLTRISPTGSYWDTVPGLVIWALGASIGFPALNIAALAGTKHGEEGLASGIISTSQRVAFPLGLAILLTIASVSSRSLSGSPGSAAAGVVSGFQFAFIASAVLTAIGFLITLLMKIQTPRRDFMPSV
jgi:EmrB/QacA subfamily drug resistance transporter